MAGDFLIVIGLLLAMHALTWVAILFNLLCERQKWFHISGWMRIQESMNRLFIAALPKPTEEDERQLNEGLSPPPEDRYIGTLDSSDTWERPS